MQAEMQEISDHLYRFAPFDQLPRDTVDAMARRVDVRYFKAGSDILEAGAVIHDLHYVRSGAVEIYRRNGELYNRLVEGDILAKQGFYAATKSAFLREHLKTA